MTGHGRRRLVPPEIGVAEHVYELYASVLGRAPTGTEISY